MKNLNVKISTMKETIAEGNLDAETAKEAIEIFFAKWETCGAPLTLDKVFEETNTELHAYTMQDGVDYFYDVCAW